MSYYLNIKKNKPVSNESLLNHLADDQARIAYIQEEEFTSEIEAFHKYFILEKSSRGIMVGLNGDTYEVIINVLCSEEDYLLATKIATQIAILTEALISPELSPVEGKNELSVEEFQKHFNEKWAKANCTNGINAFRQLIYDRGTVTIAGCLRNVYVGQDLMRRFEKIKFKLSEKRMYALLVHHIRVIQFLPLNIFVPKEYEVVEDDGRRWNYISLTYNREQLVSKTDFVILELSGDHFIKVPFHKFQEYCKYNFFRLDEEQYRMPSHRKHSFVRLMKKFENAEGNDSSNKWWKFW